MAVVGGSVRDEIDTPLLLPAFAAAGVTAVPVSWHDSQVRWSDFDMVLLRSCWDYVDDPDGFAAWLDAVAAVTHVVNDPALVRWNIRKTYLVELAAAGVPVVPTRVVPPGAAFEPPDRPYVVKPALGCGSRMVGRFGTGAHGRARAHVATLHDSGTDAVVQPFIGGAGEHDVYVIAGRITHAVHKSQVLAEGAPPAEDFRLAREQVVTPIPVTEAHRALVGRLLPALPASPVYARVDMIHTADGPLLLEAELIEPVLFLDRAAGALPAIVRAVTDALGSASPAP